MSPEQLCGVLDALMGDKHTQVEIAKVGNREELCKKLKVLENITSSRKKTGTRIATNHSDVV